MELIDLPSKEIRRVEANRGEILLLEKVERQLNGTISSLPADPIFVMNRVVRLSIVLSQYSIRQFPQTICECRSS